MSESEQKPKLIIDEDWKAQVERERELLRQKEAEGPAASSDTNASANPSTSMPLHAQTGSATGAAFTEAGSGADADLDRTAVRQEQSADDLPPPPPASFAFLVSMLGTQALAAMGQLGDEDNAPPPRLDYAKHYIDLLGVLEEKTRRNLTGEEHDLLADWLHQLRMAFVALSKK